MEGRKDRIYEALGNLLYVVAKADGIIQEEETQELEKILKDHPWASHIKWSFDYEVGKNSSPDDTYKKAIDICHRYGPTRDYDEFADLMNKIAEASSGVCEKEDGVMKSFAADLRERFLKDIEKLMQ